MATRAIVLAAGGSLVLSVLIVSLVSCGAPPDRPTNVAATGWNHSAIVRWRPPATARGPIAGYRVLSRPGGIAGEFSGKQTWGRVTGLENGVTYTFTVTAIDGAHRRSPESASSIPVTTRPVAIHVRGNQLVDGSGRAVRLLGVNRSGMEYACVSGGGAGSGLASGPSGPASIAAMASWHINAVRVPLNEDCWLGLNGASPAYSGARYRAAVAGYVHALGVAGLTAILDLHWNAPGTVLSVGQQVMADADHAPAFWRSIAASFKNDPGVIFDLYNEPTDISWDCWQRGCKTAEGWRTAGMQSLIDAVRGSGAKQPIVVQGLGYGNDLSGWLSHPLHDPLDQLIAGVHVYNTGRPGYCNTVTCWNRTLAPVAAKVPIVTGELAEYDRRPDFIVAYLRWADDQWSQLRSVSSLGWAWNAELGEGGPSLVASDDGTPTAFGGGFRAHLETLFRRGQISQG